MTPNPRSLSTVVRRWWPVPVALGLGVTAEGIVKGQYDVGGHAAEHLSSVGAPFMALAVITLILWATPAVRSKPTVLVALAAWLATDVAIGLGNLRVVEDLIAAGHAFTPTSSVPDVADHSLANAAIWWGVAAGILVVLAMRQQRQISNGVTAAAAILSVLFPPWIISGFGVVIVAVARCIAHGRSVAAVDDAGAVARSASARS
jgi:hypothetical protein